MFANLEYGPFGEVIRSTGPMAKLNPIRFSTKYQDDESDLLYYGRRYYKPSTGTWLSRDPSEEQGGLNLYGFARNDCLNQVDILGLMTRQDVMAIIKQMDDEVSQTKCCCSDSFLADPSLTGLATVNTVSLQANINILRSECPTVVLAYYWWDCFTAQQEGNYNFWNPFSNPNAWQDYGWRSGSNIEGGSHTGGRGSYFGHDPADSNHWNWQAWVIFLHCKGGHLHVEGKTTHYYWYQWDDKNQSWGNSGEPPLGTGK